MDKIEDLRNIINNSNNIVFFGGAGVSTASGIPDFRSVDGLYNQNYDYPPETIISHSFYISHMEEFYRFYKDRMLFPDALPNACHTKLASLQKQGKVKAIITQNIDGLDIAAGSTNVIEIHGSVHRNICQKCGKVYNLEYVKNSEGIPKCECGGILKPDVVLYEESLDQNLISKAIKYISECDTLIVGGTSLVVYPAAGFINYFNGDNLVLINKSKTGIDTRADLVINEPIEEVFENI